MNQMEMLERELLAVFTEWAHDYNRNPDDFVATQDAFTDPIFYGRSATDEFLAICRRRLNAGKMPLVASALVAIAVRNENPDANTN